MSTEGQNQELNQPRQMNILVAYDGSSNAQAAVAFVLNLPVSAESPITLLAVMPSQWITGHEELQSNLNRVQEALKKQFKQVHTNLIAGNPAATINSWAEEIQADLIVMGAKGLRATLGILLGGVAQQVVEYSCCPVLIVRARGDDMRKATEIQSVVLVTDGSEQSWKTVDYLAGKGCEAKALGKILCGMPLPVHANLQVLHVLPPVVSPEMAMRAWMIGPEALYPAPVEPVDWDNLQKKEEQLGNKLLLETTQALQAAGLPATGILRRGDAATEILEFVKAHDVNLIVCGSRGLSEVAGWLLGSVSRKLVHYAPCSVFIVK
jgi:nucleotide-binding universal stress UspA family protein